VDFIGRPPLMNRASCQLLLLALFTFTSQFIHLTSTPTECSSTDLFLDVVKSANSLSPRLNSCAFDWEANFFHKIHKCHSIPYTLATSTSSLNEHISPTKFSSLQILLVALDNFVVSVLIWIRQLPFSYSKLDYCYFDCNSGRHIEKILQHLVDLCNN